MEQKLFNVLSKLEMRNEKEKLNRLPDSQRIHPLDPDSAKLLSMLAVSKKAKYIVEVGSGVGYSTLWLAYAVSLTGGKLVTCEIEAAKAAETQDNITQANLSNYVEILTGDAREVLRHYNDAVDLLFIDANAKQYETYFDVVYKQMDAGGMIVADDVVTLESDLADYVSYVQNHPNLESVTVPLGDGLEITVKTAA